MSVNSDMMSIFLFMCYLCLFQVKNAKGKTKKKKKANQDLRAVGKFVTLCY